MNSLTRLSKTFNHPGQTPISKNPFPTIEMKHRFILEGYSPINYGEKQTVAETLGQVVRVLEDVKSEKQRKYEQMEIPKIKISKPVQGKRKRRRLDMGRILGKPSDRISLGNKRISSSTMAPDMINRLMSQRNSIRKNNAQVKHSQDKELNHINKLSQTGTWKDLFFGFKSPSISSRNCSLKSKSQATLRTKLYQKKSKPLPPEYLVHQKKLDFLKSIKSNLKKLKKSSPLSRMVSKIQDDQLKSSKSEKRILKQPFSPKATEQSQDLLLKSARTFVGIKNDKKVEGVYERYFGKIRKLSRHSVELEKTSEDRVKSSGLDQNGNGKASQEGVNSEIFKLFKITPRIQCEDKKKSFKSEKKLLLKGREFVLQKVPKAPKRVSQTSANFLQIPLIKRESNGLVPIKDEEHEETIVSIKMQASPRVRIKTTVAKPIVTKKKPPQVKKVPLSLYNSKRMQKPEFPKSFDWRNIAKTNRIWDSYHSSSPLDESSSDSSS
ncbi:unnamed protein product [Moneuplotes crassus]|uniref:Uncharacterized protein n=1 Tax=Euplotes crassus TaxID=5936 RepID=A0AAD1X899_EUPCR|nr:unnamed protein product [Moneuplotes crassus]